MGRGSQFLAEWLPIPKEASGTTNAILTCPFALKTNTSHTRTIKARQIPINRKTKLHLAVDRSMVSLDLN
jgi:hypothetical protein